MTAIIEKTGKGHSLRNSPITRSDKGAKAPPKSIVVTNQEFATQVSECKGLSNLPKSLFLDYKKDPSDFKRNKIVEFYSHHVQKIANQSARKLPECVNEWDLFTSGIFGLIEALSKYNPEREASFKTYCTMRVWGSMIDQLREDDWIPRKVRDSAKILSQAELSLSCILKRKPTDVEMAKALGLSMKEYWDLVGAGTPLRVMSLEDKWPGKDRGEDVLTIDIVKNDKSPCPAVEAQKRRAFSYLCKGLSRRNKMALRLYYKDDMTMREVGEALGISESRVSQLIKMSYKTMKKKLSDKEALLFADK